MAETKGGPPASLDALFKAKKKKPKAMNMNAAVEKPAPPPEKPKVVRPSPAPDSAGWERALRRDQELLKSCGLWIKEVEADGACLFRAFADQLNGDYESYRERCVDFLQAHRDEFEPFLAEDFDEYCARMRQPTAWGGEMEVQALARDLGVNAIIYQPTQAGRPDALMGSSVEVVTVEEDSVRCVQLSFHPQHHAGPHYNSVRCVDDGGEGETTSGSLTEIKRRIADALVPDPKKEGQDEGELEEADKENEKEEKESDCQAPTLAKDLGADTDSRQPDQAAVAEEPAPAAPVKKSPFKLNGRS